jgi:Cys-tRNA(Pro) deacylase
VAKKKKSTAKTMPMRVLEKKGIPYTACIHSRKTYTAEGVAADLGIPVARVVKAMILKLSEGRFALVAVPGDRQLSLKKMSMHLKDKDVKLAEARDVRRVTGYQVGAVSVLGLRREDVPAYVDESVLDLEKVFISSGRHDIGLSLSPPDLLKALSGAELGNFCKE